MLLRRRKVLPCIMIGFIFLTVFGLLFPGWMPFFRRSKACADDEQCILTTPSFDVVMPIYKFHYANENDTREFEAYLKPTNLLYPELSADKASQESRKKMQDIMKTGLHLKPYVTDRGEAGWMENGIVYRPWRRPDPSTMHKTHPSPYFTEYEPYVPFNEKMFFEGRQPPPGYEKSKKIITWYAPTRYTQRKPEPQPLKACPEFPCQITTNRDYVHKSSALILTAQLITMDPPKRHPNQVYVLHNHEPPFQNAMWQNNFRKDAWKRAFNYTMTYRTDSDFVVPYGIVRKRPTPIEGKDYKAIVAKKDKPVAWLVSNCHGSSQRRRYVEELKKHIPIDIYGKCGTMKCPHEEDDKCAKLIATRYKFYLAFESSFCTDYITEKLFHYLTMDTIVVARGSDQYYQHIPSEIYLNTADFPSPKALAERMLYLHNNNDAYIAMMKEKDKYMSMVEGFPVRNADGYIRFMAYRYESVSLCLLCQRVWNLDLHAKRISDIQTWFGERVCREPCDLKF